MENLLIVFIVVTAFAVVLQAGILAGMYFAMRKTSAKVESLAEEVKTKVLPTAELAQSMLAELRPKIENVVDNVSVSTTVLRTQVERIREAVQRTVVSPVRHISGIMHGVTAGLEAFFSRKRARASTVPQDEMFI